MKKNFVSPIFIYTILWIVLLNPIIVHCAAVPAQSGLQNFKAVMFKKSHAAQELERHRVWLNLTNDQGLFKQLLIAYVEGATNGFEYNYDGETLDANPYADFYSINEDRKLIIQGRALPFDPSDTVPLGYRSGITGDLKISIDRTDGELAAEDIYLKDNQTGTLHNLKNGPYTFSTVTGIYDNRFVISYNTGKKLGVEEFKSGSNDLSVSSKDKTITLKSAHSALRDVKVYDVSGKQLYSIQKIGNTQLEINSIQSDTQILLVKTILENGNTITRKVLF
ncbi:T9SS sorting signal type C domain-containing protein [Flavobacterium chungbukense]|nr:T9SS sorting signal type C domain-containing protein [Flavobacterium chungbukense]MCC4923798.1 T9SS sorting signal type C domain-containing protein [Flavobacterium chungbukense]